MAFGNGPACYEAVGCVFSNELIGFVDIEDGRPVPGIEWQLNVNRGEAAKFGADVTLIGNYVRMITNGMKLGEYRPDGADQEIEIVARLPAAFRNMEQLDRIRVQTDVAENIARALRAELTTEERDRVRRIPTEDLEAYDLFVRAVSACQGMLPEDLATAVEYCQEAIRLDPDFAQAYAMLAQCHVLSGFYANQRPSDLFPKVREAASRALELDPQCGEAHTAMAVFKIQYERDSEGIEEELARALELNPDDSFAYIWKGIYLMCRGHFTEAEGVMRQGLVSDPLSPLGHHDLGQVLAFGGRADEAIQVLESAVRHWPDLSLLHLWLGLSHLYVNEPESALPHFEIAVELSGPLPFFDSTRGIGLAAVGRVAEAREVLEDLEARSRSEYVDPFNLFNLTASLDGFDAAAPHLDEALEARSFFLPYLGVIPRYRPLHSDPRFRAVLDTVWPGVSFEV